MTLELDVNASERLCNCLREVTNTEINICQRLLRRTEIQKFTPCSAC